MGLHLSFELVIYLYFVEKTVSENFEKRVETDWFKYAVQRDNGPRLKSWFYISIFV